MSQAAREAQVQREKRKHDANADKLNKTTYTGTGDAGYVDPRTATTGLASRIKKKKDMTAGDAAAALAKGKK
jgi:hypothetical protein